MRHKILLRDPEYLNLCVYYSEIPEAFLGVLCLYLNCAKLTSFGVLCALDNFIRTLHTTLN